MSGGAAAAAAAAEPLPLGTVDFPVLDCSEGLLAGAPRWQVLDDAVMGGASSSGIAYNEQERALVFSGESSREGGVHTHGHVILSTVSSMLSMVLMMNPPASRRNRSSLRQAP